MAALLASILIYLGIDQAFAEPAAGAAAAVSESDDPPILLRERTLFETAMLSAEGKQYRILVSAPEGPAPAGGFPVIYVLDGDAWFGIAVEIARLREYSKLDPAVIVGVAYPSRSFFDARRRSYDFTPPAAADFHAFGVPLGGADQFLSFLTGALRNWVNSNYQADPNRQILFGHSLGGMFALHTIFVAPESFSDYIAASPSIGFANKLLLKEAKDLEVGAAHRGPRLLVTYGGLESGPTLALREDYKRYYAVHPKEIPGQTPEEAVEEIFSVNPNFDRVAKGEKLVANLAKQGVNATFVVFEGEEHSSSAVSALNRGVPFVLRPK